MILLHRCYLKLYQNAHGETVRVRIKVQKNQYFGEGFMKSSAWQSLGESNPSFQVENLTS